MTHQHAVVWIDHREAHILRFGVTGVARENVRSMHKHEHLHHKANTIGAGRATIDTTFFERITGSFVGATAILIAGPASAKNELADYLRHKHPNVAKAIVAVVPLNHPSEGELLKFGKTYFKRLNVLQLGQIQRSRRSS